MGNLTERCPCGQTYGTCAKHLQSPERASYLIVRENGDKWASWIRRPRMASDKDWKKIQSQVAERLSETLVPVHHPAKQDIPALPQ